MRLKKRCIIIYHFLQKHFIMKKIFILSIYFFGILFSNFAQESTLIAYYPFDKDGKEKEGYYRDFQLLNVNFEDKSICSEGVYGDYSKKVGNLIRSPQFPTFDHNHFSISLFFKATQMKRMPIVVVGATSRVLFLSLTDDGKLEMFTNNGDNKYFTKGTYKANEWYNVIITFSKKTLNVYQNKINILTENNVNLNDKFFSQDKNIMNVNFGQGRVFNGCWKDLKIYKGVCDINEAYSPINANNNVVVNPNNNNVVVNPNNNNVVVNNKTILGDWKQLNVAIEGNTTRESYNQSRQFFSSKNKENGLNIIWQDVKNKNIFLTVVAKDFKNSTNKKLSLDANVSLLAATNDENDNFYVMVFNKMPEDKNDFLTLYKLSKNGGIIAKKRYSSDKKDLDIYKVGNYAGTLVHQGGVLGFFMGRTMNKSTDGLNHQGGIGVTFDANSLEIIKNTGQTSGHSFDNFLTKNEAGDFIGIDLGDNYPRGINLHRMTRDDRSSKLVYTFKTEHGSTANGYGRIFPKYEEISTPQKSFYKWSNDNGTYSELGGVVEVNDGYLVIFAGEPDAQGKSLNSSRIDKNTDARNLGFVKIAKDFYDYKKYPYDEKTKHIISQGNIEVGGFYTFGGTWSAQENKGVNWLTKYKNKEKENVRNIKTQILPNGNILILWSKTTDSYWNPTSLESLMMVIDKNGKIITNPILLAKDIIFNRRDEILMIDNKIISVQAKENNIQVNFLELK